MKKQKLLSLPLILTFIFSLSLFSAESRPCFSLLNGVMVEVGHGERKFAHEGLFERAPKKILDDVMDRFKKNGTGGKSFKKGEIRAFKESEAAINLAKLDPQQAHELYKLGLMNINEFYHVVSVAGLWTRGGGQVKALVPLNSSLTLDPKDASRLAQLGDIFSAKKLEDFFLPFPDFTGPKNEETAFEMVELAKKEVADLVWKSKMSNKNITAMDINIVQAALASELSGGYYMLDFWTSAGKNNKAVQAYKNWLVENVESKTFHPNSEVDSKLKNIVKKYLKMSDARGETHILAYQEDIPAIVAKTGEFEKGGVEIGKGQGAIFEYIVNSGRADELAKGGRKYFLSENVEVHNDIPLALGAFVKSKADVGVVLVPERPNFKGGHAYTVKKGDKWVQELHEDSAIDETLFNSFKNKYFNTNTIFTKLDAKHPVDFGFEEKEHGRIVRSKLGVGNITEENRTKIILGELTREAHLSGKGVGAYEDFKNYRAIIDWGEQYVQTHQDDWASKLINFNKLDPDVLARSNDEGFTKRMRRLVLGDKLPGIDKLRKKSTTEVGQSDMVDDKSKIISIIKKADQNTKENYELDKKFVSSGNYLPKSVRGIGRSFVPDAPESFTPPKVTKNVEHIANGADANRNKKSGRDFGPVKPLK